MVLVWQMVPSAAGMLLVMQRLLLLMHQSSLQTSCWGENHEKAGDERGEEFPFSHTGVIFLEITLPPKRETLPGFHSV